MDMEGGGHTQYELNFIEAVATKIGNRLAASSGAYPGNPDFIYYLKNGKLPEKLEFEYEE